MLPLVERITPASPKAATTDNTCTTRKNTFLSKAIEPCLQALCFRERYDAEDTAIVLPTLSERG
jgi:hypothetical protein